MGHPKIIANKFFNLENYFGLINHCVLSPEELYLPVLPKRMNDKLLFPLCMTCAQIKQQTPCEYSQTQRAFLLVYG